jgi:hypothetical protein
MKKILLLTFVLGIIFSGFAQRATVSKDLLNVKVKKIQPTLETMNFSHDVLPAAAVPEVDPDEDIIGTTWYDLQSNATMQNRIFVYDDGTIGCVFTFGEEYDQFPDRGTGYNYFDGSEWGEEPVERLEAERTGWPSYASWGEDGEIIVSHYSNAPEDGLAFSRRATKGTGVWTQFDYHAPDPDKDYVWPRIATGGVNHSVMHCIALCRGAEYGGGPYQGIDCAFLYSRSENGGDTWSIDGKLFEEMSSTYYNQFHGDTYSIEAQGENNVAFLYGDDWTGLVLMKSTDGGETFTQTIIWEHPYPLWNDLSPFETDGFYGTDGSHSLAFDQSGKVHIVFGITWSQYSLTPQPGYYWRAGVDGVGYWNEDRPTFSADTMALSPYGEPGSELVEDYSLIGWAQDLNGNDTIDLTPFDLPNYSIGMSSMPQILIDDMNQIFVVYSSYTEGYISGLPDEQTCRHLWCRTSPNGEWWGTFTDLSTADIHMIDDCLWPSIASYSDDNFYLVYQHDNQPGMAVRGLPTTAFGENFISVMTVRKDSVWTSVKENNIPIYDYDVLQNYPNPFTGSSTVKVNVRQSAELSLEVINMMGQKVYTVDAGIAKPGMNTITIDGTKLSPGVYFYTVRAGETAITKKMIVE